MPLWAACLFLALRAVVGAAPGNHDPFHRRPADQTTLTFPPINAVLKLKKAFFTVGIYVVGNRRATESDRFSQNFLNCSVQSAKLVSGQRGRAPPWPYACTKERFVRINVAHAAQQFLIQQSALDRRFSAAKQAYKPLQLDLEGL